MKEERTVLEQIVEDQEINVSDDGIQTISVLAEAQLELEQQMEEINNQLKVIKKLKKLYHLILSK